MKFNERKESTMKELALNDAFDGILDAVKSGKADDLMALTGQSGDSTPKQGLSRLAINYDTETDDGTALPRGKWKIMYDGAFVYADQVNFRPLVRTFEYSVWDAEENKFSARSVQAPSINHRFPDTTGGEKCGRLSKSEEEQLGADHPKTLASRAATCNQIMYGLVSLTGKNAGGKEVTIEDFPVVAYFKRSGFRPAKDAIDKITGMRKLMHETVFSLTTDRKKMGSVTYFVPVFSYDSDKKLGKDDLELLGKFLETIKASNDNILEQYREAQKALQTEDEVDLAADFS